MSEEKNKICGTDLISRYHDGELDPQKALEVKTHIDSCPECRDMLSKYVDLTDKMGSGFMRNFAHDNMKIENGFIESITKEKKNLWERWTDLVFTKRILIPAGIAASLAVLFITFSLDNSPAGPSAIIKSISGSGSTVMIMETTETHQTILWFNENG